MSTPPALPDPWVPLRALRDVVLDAAGWRCQCTGACGHQHPVAKGGRCSVIDSPRHRLIAATARPGSPAQRASTLPAADLRACCPACHRHTAALARAALDAAMSDQPTLLGDAS